MLSQGSGGRSSIGPPSSLIGLATSAHYVAAKHGVVMGLTRARRSNMPYGIRVNCVNPGYVATPMTKETIRGAPARKYWRRADAAHGRSNEIAKRWRGWCSDKASFMTAASHVIDGGY